MNEEPWIGYDLDGTLAHYDGWKGAEHIGAPILPMVNRLLADHAAGKRVKIFTARIVGHPDALAFINSWCQTHLGFKPEVTATKDMYMRECYDDRARQVVPNTGILVEHQLSEAHLRLMHIHDLAAPK